MKYMGSKKYMLRNGLGELIIEQAHNLAAAVRGERQYKSFRGRW